jgi:hypothetical protein
MLAMSLLLGCFEPATTAASMAICRPEAIDDAPACWPERSGGWRRRGFLGFREEWPEARGRKSRRRRCGSGDRGEAVLRPDQASERPCGRAPNSMHGRRRGRRWLPRTRGPALQAGRKTPWRADRTGCNPPEPQRLRRLSSSILRTGEIGADLSKPHEYHLTAASGCRPGHLPISSLITDEADDHPCLAAPPSRWVAGPPAMRCPSSGGTNSAIRAQAVPPTAIAPMTAKVTRQASDGMPIWAKPSVPLYPAIAAGTV